MGAKKHVVEFSDEDRKMLEWFIWIGDESPKYLFNGIGP